MAGSWPSRRPLRRAAGYQGVFPVKMDMSLWSPDEVAELTEIMRNERGDLTGYDIVVGGSFEAGRSRFEDYAWAGATWYVAGPGPGQSVAEVERAIEAGPG